MPRQAANWFPALTVALALVFTIGLPLAPRSARARPLLNTWTTLVLHVVPHDPTNHCFTPQDAGFDCSVLHPPRVSVTPFAAVDVYLYVRNYDELCGVQCAFEWPVEWRLQYWWPGSLGGCQSNQIIGVSPRDPGGPTAGTLAAVFDCVAAGYLAPVGYMCFNVGISGCLTIVESSYPFGTHILDHQHGDTSLDPAGWGRVCVGDGGIDTCETLEPVEPVTWGRLKSVYRHGSPRQPRRR